LGFRVCRGAVVRFLPRSRRSACVAAVSLEGGRGGLVASDRRRAVTSSPGGIQGFFRRGGIAAWPPSVLRAVASKLDEEHGVGQTGGSPVYVDGRRRPSCPARLSTRSGGRSTAPGSGMRWEAVLGRPPRRRGEDLPRASSTSTTVAVTQSTIFACAFPQRTQYFGRESIFAGRAPDGAHVLGEREETSGRGIRDHPRLERRWRRGAGRSARLVRRLLPSSSPALAELAAISRWRKARSSRGCRIGYRTLGELDAGRLQRGPATALPGRWERLVSSWRQVLRAGCWSRSRNLREPRSTPSGNGRLLSPSNGAGSVRQRLSRVSMRDVVESQQPLVTLGCSA